MTNKQTISQSEEEILKFWQDNKIFEKSVERDAPNGDYVFYDGPPFATGLPHYGHIVVSLMKDAVPRYWTMKGYRVERRWGWDCHGLPIENIVEKELGTKSKKDIEENVGVDKFNETCRSKVMMYADEWKKVIPRIGRWVDMENDYKTMDPDYMESIWWVFKTLWDNDYIYEGHKAMHICPRCETTLSQSEVSEGYKIVKDLSVITKFKITDQDFLNKYCEGKPTSFIAWTTTPWSLPTTMALAVGGNFNYQVVDINGEQVIFVKERTEYIEHFFPEARFKVINSLMGNEMTGVSYEHPFGHIYLEHPDVKGNDKVYKTYLTDYVSTEDGTGIVTINGSYGEIDMKAAQEIGLPIVMNVRMDGTFTEEMGDLAGVNVKPIENTQSTDVEIIRYLAKKEALFAKEKYEHSYPHCWRCDTPLLNYATSSWFVNVIKLKPKMLELVKDINWTPEHIKEGRFGKWLEGARDWSISRQRFWGSVMPIWKCNQCNELKVFGNKTDLEKIADVKITDLHKHTMDKITFHCEKCQGKMKRIPDVLDCWFESGSMPYAQVHYPFENKEKFENTFPAEFIAEATDQTRAWFYYLIILSTALKESIPFKNAIVNGIVLAEDGHKMSKKLQNYPDPMKLVDKYSADAMRYYLLSSPVMKADTLNFSEKGVDEVYKKLILILSNVLTFYKTFDEGIEVANLKKEDLTNVMDIWICSKLENLKQEVTKQMDVYDLVQGSRPIIDFINELSTWYIRRSRDRFKSTDEAEKIKALKTLRHTLINLAKLMAPFTPFIAERLWQDLNINTEESVHLASWPIAEPEFFDENVLSNMEAVRKIAEAALAARAEAGIKIRQPLASYSTSLVKKLEPEYSEILQDELNIKEIKFGEDILDTELTPELKEQGLVRELIRFINSERKNQKLTINDNVNLYYNTSDQEIKNALTNYPEEIKENTRAKKLILEETDNESWLKLGFKDREVFIRLEK